jgi:ABC-type dipeptide/oligopeptide/nickel transport system permease component
MSVALLAYAARRIALFVPTFLAITFIGFAIIHLAPGDPVELYLSGGLASGQAGISTQKIADAEKAKAALRHELGLDRPIAVQYVDWLPASRGATSVGAQGPPAGVGQDPRAPSRDKAIDHVAVHAYLVAVPLGIYWRCGPEAFRSISTVVCSCCTRCRASAGVMLIVFFCSGDHLPGSRGWAALAALLGGLAAHAGRRPAAASDAAVLVTTLGSYTELSASSVRRCSRTHARTSSAPRAPRACPSAPSS